MAVKMTDKDVIERVHRLLAPRRARVRHVPERRPHKQDCWEVTVTGSEAEELMRRLLPFMGERRAAKITELLSYTDWSHLPKGAPA
jgi:hypothetical protein